MLSAYSVRLALLLPALFGAFFASAQQACPYPGCPAGALCNASLPATCASLRCTLNLTSGVNTCVAPSCTDNILNGYEPALDCGGNCRACGDASRCFVPSDCRSGVCANTAVNTPATCRPASCYDGAASTLSGETDIDCGTVCCPRDQPLAVCASLCRDGFRCASYRDCKSLRCYKNDAAGGNFYCAGSRVTDDYPVLGSRLISAVRLRGQKKRSFSESAFLTAIAFMVGVPTSQVKVEALTDVALPAELGVGAYAAVRGNNSGVVFSPTTGEVIYPMPGQAARRRLGGAAGTSSSLRRGLQSFVTPTYFISSSDLSSGVDVRFSVYVRPSEAGMMHDRLAGAVNGSAAVLPGGWDWEDKLLRQDQLARKQRDYCAQYYRCWNRTDDAFFASFNIDCETYFPNATCVRPSAGNSTLSSTTVISTGRRQLTSPLVYQYWDPYVAGNWSFNYSWGVNIASLSRITLADAIASLDPGITGVAGLEASYIDPFAEAPSQYITPTGLSLVQQPTGVPRAPLYAGSPFAIQPAVALIDAHGRIATVVDQQLRITATLEPDEVPPAQEGRIYLTGQTIMRSNGTDGIVVFSDLGISEAPNGTVKTVRLRFNCTYRYDATGSDLTLLELTGVTPPFIVLPPPVIPVIPYVREPLNPWIVAFLFFLSAGIVLGGVWYGIKSWRRSHTPARISPDALAMAAAAATALATKKKAEGDDVDVVAIDSGVDTGEGEECDRDGGGSTGSGSAEDPSNGQSGSNLTRSGRVLVGDASSRSRRLSAGSGAPQLPGVVTSEASLPGIGPSFAAALANTLTSLAHVEAKPPSPGQEAQAHAAAATTTTQCTFGWSSRKRAPSTAAAAVAPALAPATLAILERYAVARDPHLDEYDRRQEDAKERAYAREAARNGAGLAAFKFAMSTIGASIASGASAAAASVTAHVQQAVAQVQDEYSTKSGLSRRRGASLAVLEERVPAGEDDAPPPLSYTAHATTTQQSTDERTKGVEGEEERTAAAGHGLGHAHDLEEETAAAMAGSETRDQGTAQVAIDELSALRYR